MKDTIYLGDAVYAHFDGYGVELKLNDHRAECLIYLEPNVLENLIKFRNEIQCRCASYGHGNKLKHPD